MFAWLRDRRREIFRFHDGIRRRRIDPIPTIIALESHELFNPRDDPRLLESGDTDASLRVSQAVREVFGIQQLNDRGKGLTMTEQLAVLTRFYLFLEMLKKKSSPSPTPPLPTEASTSTRYMLGDMPLFADSGGPSTGPNSGTPTASESAPSPPSESAYSRENTTGHFSTPRPSHPSRPTPTGSDTRSSSSDARESDAFGLPSPAPGGDGEGGAPSGQPGAPGSGRCSRQGG